MECFKGKRDENSKIDCGDACTNLNIPKAIELYTLTGELYDEKKELQL